MLVPLIFFPDIYRSVALDIISSLTVNYSNNLDVFFTDGFSLIMGCSFAACIIFYLVTTFQANRGWIYDGIEIMVLALFFSLVHPVLAIGLYFCFWHGLRHIIRIVGLQQDVAPGAFNNQMMRFVRTATPTTLAALGLLTAMYFLAPNHPNTLQEFIGLYLILIAILTVPHVWVVTKMDIRKKIWSNTS